jgi:hypothetical protein
MGHDMVYRYKDTVDVYVVFGQCFYEGVASRLTRWVTS